jgi:NADH dehydrogenase
MRWSDECRTTRLIELVQSKSGCSTMRFETPFPRAILSRFSRLALPAERSDERRTSWWRPDSRLTLSRKLKAILGRTYSHRMRKAQGALSGPSATRRAPRAMGHIGGVGWIGNATMAIDGDVAVNDRRPAAGSSETSHRVVIVGGGFGGLEVAAGLAGAPVIVTLVDQRNYHLFQPLLYQVATASLATSEIAWPIRYLMRYCKEVTTILATAVGVDADMHRVLLEDGCTIRYDTLVLATGARHAYFGYDEWEAFAPGLKTLEDATTIRRRILLAFERAECEIDPRQRAALLTFVIIGAGPTGVELAGTIAELARDTLRPDFRNIDTRTARVVLIEAGSRVLAGFAQTLSAYAQRSLERLGVEIELNQPVSECSPDGVVYGGRNLEARTIIWAAGVRASPAAEWLGAPADRAGRLMVLPDLTVPGRPEIFAIGDTVSIAGPDGKPVPGIAPAAKQQGRYVAKVMRGRLLDHAAPHAFRYKHAGSLATIGKRLAVIDFGRINLRGALAWWIWGIAHIYFLIGVRNRLNVVINWLWIHIRDQRAARLITQRRGKNG